MRQHPNGLFSERINLRPNRTLINGPGISHLLFLSIGLIIGHRIPLDRLLLPLHQRNHTPRLTPDLSDHQSHPPFAWRLGVKFKSEELESSPKQSSRKNVCNPDAVLYRPFKRSFAQSVVTDQSCWKNQPKIR
jgi:hypothetical protein